MNKYIITKTINLIFMSRFPAMPSDLPFTPPSTIKILETLEHACTQAMTVAERSQDQLEIGTAEYEYEKGRKEGLQLCLNLLFVTKELVK